jgi:hypothetical protein
MRILDLGWKNTRIRDPGWKKFGSGINILDPQRWYCLFKSMPMIVVNYMKFLNFYLF